MFTLGQKNGTVQFIIKPDYEAKKVQVAGDFTNWCPVNMRRQKDGTFTASVPMPPGRYEYKFITDDQWVLDPDNNNWVCNPFGTLNSLAQL